MSKLGDVLKKVGGVVTGVASTLVKAIPVVGNVASAALSSISTKLLQSPTPIKESATALITNAPVGISTPIKQSSLQLQLGVPPQPSTPIKQSSYDLTGQSMPSTSIPASNLVSMSGPSPAVKTVQDIINGVSGSAAKLGTGAIIAIAVGVVGVIVLLFSLFGKKRRRK